MKLNFIKLRAEQTKSYTKGEKSILPSVPSLCGKGGENVPVELIKRKSAHPGPSICYSDNLLAIADPGARVQSELWHLCGQRWRRGEITSI